MTFRSRLLVAFLLAALVPLIALALFVRNEMGQRLTAQYGRRVEALVGVIGDDLARQGASVASSLETIRAAAAADNRLRRAVVDRDPEERAYLLDYAGNAMRITGMSMLQIQDEAGRILSSGHFRNEYDRLEPDLPRLLDRAAAAALVQVRAPDDPFLVLARVDSLWMGGRLFTIVGGVKVGDAFLAGLARDEDLNVTLEIPGEASATDRTGVVGELGVPFVGASRANLDEATFRVTHGLTELESLRSDIDRWFLIALVVAIVLAAVLVAWMSSRVSKPLAELAEKTSRIDLDRLDVDFDTRRSDEIGALARLLGAMTDRLRVSAVRTRDAERRAARGELARQVNHDIKNGLTPIRNVFRHLSELARGEPGQLRDAFREREGTLESSMSYLEDLASNYARLSPRGESRPCDVGEVARRVVTDLRGTGAADLRVELHDKTMVLGDAVALRRVIENLVDNAIDSLESGRGSVTVTAERVVGGTDPLVRVTVTDTGAGMSEEQQARVFDDFYTTKKDGTGLGLSIVRRIVMDLGGAVRVESEPGRGSRFILELPGVD